MTKKTGLGKGLDALLINNVGEEEKVQKCDYSGLFCYDPAWMCRAGGGGTKSDTRFAIVHI